MFGRTINRRDALCALAAALAAMNSSGTARAAEPISFGLTPVFLANDLELLANLKSYLEARTGQLIKLVLRRTYQEITALLISRQIDAAWICGYPFVAHKADLALLAVPVWRGKPHYQSYLITGADRQVVSLKELRRDIHAFSDPDSNSGYLVTAAALAELGVYPNAFFSRSFFTYGHRNVVQAVASGLAQSGSVDGYVWEVMAETEPSLTARTRVIWKSEWLGFPPVCTAASTLSSPHSVHVLAALHTMPATEEGRALLRLLRLDGFTHASPELYDPIAHKMQKVRGVD